MPKIALLQMTSGINPEVNFGAIEDALHSAREAGAQILFTPEMALLLDKDRKRASQAISSSNYGQYVGRFADLCHSLKMDLALGSMPVALPNGKLANRSHYFFGNRGNPICYDKMHMFDVELSNGETWRESSAYEAGQSIVTTPDTPVGRLGFSICYDMRFPALFGALGNQRCDTIAVPAAFTKPTGEAHWHILLRARAIEASAFIIASAQVGLHEDGRETYGHSLVVDPWGEVLLDMGGKAAGLGFCDIDLTRIQHVRNQIPSLANRGIIPE